MGDEETVLRESVHVPTKIDGVELTPELVVEFLDAGFGGVGLRPTGIVGEVGYATLMWKWDLGDEYYRATARLPEEDVAAMMLAQEAGLSPFAQLAEAVRTEARAAVLGHREGAWVTARLVKPGEEVS